MASAALTRQSNRRRVQFMAAFVLVLLATAWAPITEGNTRQPNLDLKPVFAAPQRTPFFQADKPDEKDNLVSIDVEFEMRPDDEGVLLFAGDDAETFALYVMEGRVVWSYQGVLQHSADSIVSDPLLNGLVTVHFEFDGEHDVDVGRHRIGSMFVNGKFAGRISGTTEANPQADWPAENVAQSQLEDLLPEFSFSGKITKVAVNRTKVD